MIRPFCITIPVLFLSSRLPLCAIYTKRGNYTPPPLYIFTNVHLAQRILFTSFYLIFFILPLRFKNVNCFFSFCNFIQNSPCKNVLFLQFHANFTKIEFYLSINTKIGCPICHGSQFFLFFRNALMQPIRQRHQAISQMHIFHLYSGMIHF